ncbi:MAG: GvpL/GvpF family gas vesicle protein [Chloroflexota bacterium]
MVRTYLYGIIDSGDEAGLGMTGLDGASSVYSVGHEGIGCVVSDYHGEPLQSLPKEEVLRRLFAHQEVTEGATRRRHAVLPVKFGTMVNTPDEVRGLLAQGHQQFVGALSFIQDKVELDVAATWHMEQELQAVAEEEKVTQARDALASRGQPTLEQRVQLGQMVKASLDRRRDSYRKQMVDFLGPQAVDVAVNALVSDEMVMNVAFLVECARQDEFDSAVRQLDDLFKNQFTFRVIGPLPPYSFATVEVARLTSAQIDEARRMLGLGDMAPEGDIRKAYRHLAAGLQRTLGPGEKPDKGHLARLRQSSDLLLRYRRAQKEGQLGGGGRGFGSHDDRDGFFTVGIKRSESHEVEATRFGAAEAR